MIGNRYIATTSVLLATCAAPLVSAQTSGAVPITIGRLGISHGYLMVAWTPTKTTMQDACAGTRTMIQSVHTNFPSNPLCGFPFEVDGVKNMELVCDPAQSPREIPVAITTDGKRSHNCTHLPLTIYSTYCGGGASLAQEYACQ
ncbi:hypothetical protein V8F20_009082 [Naviculisporaceae sp. PSN 640]